jgi:hypothetical protein
MRQRTLAVVLVCALMLVASCVFGQDQFNITLRGTAYSTNAAGNIVATPISDHTILQELGTAIGMTDVSGWGLVYHLNASVFGDTIHVIDKHSGAKLGDYVFGLFFGDSSLPNTPAGRTGLTNALQTEIRRVDRIVTQQSIYELGSAFVTKRFSPDANGRTTIDGDMHWLVRPVNGQSARLCTASFTTTTPFKPQP